MARPSLNKRKNDLINYIVESMNDYDFDRGLGLHEDFNSDQNIHEEAKVLGFKSWPEFVSFQQFWVGRLKTAEIKFYEELINRLNNKAMLMDKESMVAFDYEGFAFDHRGNLILFNSR